MATDTARARADWVARLRLPAGAGIESWIVGAAFSLYCWLVAPATSDLAAATFRSDLFDRGVLVYNAQWYDGHHLPAYSLLSPPLGALIGTRLVGALCTFGAIVLFERLAVPLYGRSGRAGALLFAVTAGLSLLIGRIAFAVGLLFAVWAVHSAVRSRFVRACVLAALSALGSPLAGLFLALMAGVWLVVRRRPWGLALATSAVVPSLVLQFAFEEGGTFPYGWISFLQLVLFVAIFLLALPRDERLVQVGAVAYLAAGLYAQLVPSQLGGNINRLGTTIGAPLLACLLWERRRLVLLVALPYLLWWPIHSVVRDLPDAGGVNTTAGYYRPLVDHLRQTVNEPVRIEIPPTRNHWEGVYVGRYFQLTRGWERQLDQKYAALFYGTLVTAERYERYLRHNGVSYVALSDSATDFASGSEADLLRQSLPPYLREVWRSRHWVLYRMERPGRLLSGPGRLTATSDDSFSFQAERAGRFVMRLHFTPYWALTSGSGCVRAARGNWTEVRVRRPGRVHVGIRFNPIRAVSQGPRCT